MGSLCLEVLRALIVGKYKSAMCVSVGGIMWFLYVCLMEPLAVCSISGRFQSSKASAKGPKPHRFSTGTTDLSRAQWV